MSTDWNNGLCSCFEDCSTCIITLFVPCYTFGKNAEQLGENCVMYGLSWMVPILNIWCRTQIRGKIREQQGIDGSCLNDLLWVFFCEFCTMVQEARQLQGPGGQSMARE
ncbi:uncharacterized protein LOC135337132 [Halichondria panicea]|uniref:uncharacterized protein LOC135337132 n=1 Tax=Halichondria panicea TaxID=6063 RepID=UPI00312B6214